MPYGGSVGGTLHGSDVIEDRKIFQVKTPWHVFRMSNKGTDDYEDFKDWLEDNMQGQWKIFFISKGAGQTAKPDPKKGWQIQTTRYGMTLEIDIKDDADASLFKLSWM